MTAIGEQLWLYILKKKFIRKFRAQSSLCGFVKHTRRHAAMLRAAATNALVDSSASTFSQCISCAV
jgi:hypothetical protein